MNNKYKLLAGIAGLCTLAGSFAYADGPHTARRPARKPAPVVEKQAEPVAPANGFQDRFYARLGVLYPVGLQVSDMQKGKVKVGGQVAFGWNFHPMFSTELEANFLRLNPFTQAGTDQSIYKTNTFAGFANLLVHPEQFSYRQQDLRFHIGAGVGYAKSKVTNEDDSWSKSSLAWQGILGLEWNVQPDVSLVLDARYVSFGKLRDRIGFAARSADKSVTAQTINFSIKYKF